MTPKCRLLPRHASGPVGAMSTSTTKPKRTKRRNTAQDHATLRLHRDGTRVDLYSPQRSDLRPSRKYNAGRDARGNRVARDAAGLGVIPKRPAPLKDGSIETISSGPDVSADEVRSVKPRRRKRRRLNHDFEFLKDPSNVSVPSSVRAVYTFSSSLAHFVFLHMDLGPVEVRELLCMPVLRRAGSAAGPIARVRPQEGAT
jgi:hypothetical protein